MLEIMTKKNKKEETGKHSSRIADYDPYAFNGLVDDALGINNKKEDKGIERKIMKATERDLLKYMHNGEWQKISEFKYRMPSLREWVCELEYRFWSQKDVVNSHWQQ